MNTHQLTPRKRFGQHFLQDEFIIERIVDAINPKLTDTLVEIGPGIGALTLPMLKRATQLHAIELDTNLVPLLLEACQDHGKLLLYHEDALSFNFARCATPPQKMRIFGNLPYNISTPLLFHVLTYGQQIQDMHFMLQKEVVDRLAATPGSRDYGRLSIMVQYHCAVTRLFFVPPHAFLPPPKVNSAVVQLIPHAALPDVAIDYALFYELVRCAFGMRRKILGNALKKRVNPEIWQIIGIDPQLRPERLSVKDYVELSNAVAHHR